MIRKSFLLIAIALVFSGCSKGIPTSGKVKFSDGEPVTSGYVFFSDGQTAGRGEIHQDGTYTMGMLKPGEGLPPGKYKVYLAGGPSDTSKDSVGVPLIDSKYFTYQDTPLSVEVTTGKAVPFDIVVERNPAVKK
jgi:hypothetical protein